MNLRRTWAIARKEFLHVLRDPRSLGMGIAIPMLLLILFGYALTLDVDRVPIVVWDQSQTAASRELVSRLGGSRYFTIVRYVVNHRGMEEAIDRGEALGALVIPVRFADLLDSGREAPVQFIVDGSDSNTATLALGYADSVAFAFSRDTVIRQFNRRGGTPLQIPIDVRPRMWFNADMESKDYIIPGLIAVIMMVIAALLTSLTVAREWECGTMEQLISTPVKGHELILGKLVPYFCIGMFDVVVAVAMSRWMFDVPLRGNVGLLLGVAAVFLLGVLSAGILISTVAKGQLLASQVAIVTTYLPSFLLSGFMFAVGNMPEALQWATLMVPARYFIALLRGLFLKGVGLDVLGRDALLMLAFSAVMLCLAIGKFKKVLK